MGSPVIAQPAASVPSIREGEAEPAGSRGDNREKLPLGARILIIFGSALACWAGVIAAVMALSR